MTPNRITSEELPKVKDPVAVVKNRSQRRAETRISDKPVNNNRKQTKARKGNNLYLKMAAFAMSITDKQMRARHK